MSSKQAGHDLVRQIDTLIQRIPDAQYQQALTVFNGSSLGQHFRHILNFYECVVQGGQGERIDYARRQRDPRIETETAYARTAYATMLQGMDTLDEGQAIDVVGDFHAQANERPALPSSIGRELMYAFDHAVHHLALIRIGLAELGLTEADDHQLGVAPSTVRHRQQA